MLLRPGLPKTEAQFRRDYGRLEALEDAGRRERLRVLLREVMVRNTRAHIDLKLPRRLAETQVVRPEAAEADLLASLAAVIRDRFPAASAADRWRLMMLQMQAGSSPSARSRSAPPARVLPGHRRGNPTEARAVPTE